MKVGLKPGQMRPGSDKPRGGRVPVQPIEKHPRYGEIVDDILAGEKTFAQICREYKVSRNLLDAHIRTKLALAVRDAEMRTRLDSVPGIRERLAYHLARMEKMAAACDAYLSDPDDPTRFYLGPQAHEVRVVYYSKGDDGKRIRATAMLDELTSRLETELKIEVAEMRFDGVNPRKLFIDSAVVATKQLEVLARLLENANKLEGDGPIMATELWAAFQEVVLGVARDDPDVLRVLGKIEAALP